MLGVMMSGTGGPAGCKGASKSSTKSMPSNCPANDIGASSSRNPGRRKAGARPSILRVLLTRAVLANISLMGGKRHKEVFFFEKKKQKTFANASGISLYAQPEWQPKRTKVFWFFF
jgi:hypothetical protein